MPPARRQVFAPSAGYHLGIGRRLAIVIVALALVLGGLGWAGVSTLESGQSALERMYSNDVVTTQMVGRLGARIDDAEEAILYALATTNALERQRAMLSLNIQIIPDVDVLLANVSRRVSDSPKQAITARLLAEQWSAFLQRVAGAQFQGSVPAVRAAQAAEFKTTLDPITSTVAQLVASERVEAAEMRSATLGAYRGGVVRLIVVVAGGFLVAMAVLLWLASSLLPRVRSYARFAQRLAAGDYGSRLDPRGRDEIDQLGSILDTVAQRRYNADRHNAAQAEFSEALQLTADQGEAQDLLRRHLERSIPGATVAVLNSNNSEDRLEAVSGLPDGSLLRAGLGDASPRSCLAIRGAGAHDRRAGHEPLVECAVCGRLSGDSCCSPLLVGGEVIGSVLVSRDGAIDEDAQLHIRESVRQAAPVIANLRNLEISQMRAATDALTGLANRRSLDDTLKRMVAQAHRSGFPLAALMLDLDHFKQVNDDLGHAKGDEILAAFGIQLQSLLRASDFAARYGGEEFVVLLPATDEQGALAFAERILRSLRNLPLPLVDRDITTSVGVAVLPDHALDSEALQRAADRALYAAKTNGRNRVEVASLDAPVAAGQVA